jgi:hypothetical protein
MTNEPQTTKPETVEEWKEKASQLIGLLIECRDALPAISLTSAKLRGIDLNLDKRIEDALKPWEVHDGTGI